MNESLLVDTDILIDVARKEHSAVEYLKLEENRSILQVSLITQMELIIGCRNKSELQALDEFLKRYIVIDVTHDISEKAVALLKTYRLSHGLLIADALIAATAFPPSQAGAWDGNKLRSSASSNEAKLPKLFHSQTPVWE